MKTKKRKGGSNKTVWRRCYIRSPELNLNIVKEKDTNGNIKTISKLTESSKNTIKCFNDKEPIPKPIEDMTLDDETENYNTKCIFKDEKENGERTFAVMKDNDNNTFSLEKNLEDMLKCKTISKRNIQRQTPQKLLPQDTTKMELKKILILHILN